MSEIFKSYYAIIPANVRYDKELKDKAKLLYGEITALCNEKGYCWATNNYFAELYDVSKETISRLISNLANKGYVKVEIIYEGKQIVGRHLYITQPEILTQKSIGIDEKINTPPIDNKRNTPIDKIVNTPIDENVKDNNTKIFNNKYINNQSINPEELTLTEDDMIDEIEYEENYEEIIAKNIELEIMKHRYGEFYEEIYNIIIDAVTRDDEYIRIGKKNIPTQKVIAQFLKLNQFHIECVISKYNSYNGKIVNEPAFILTCLYNSFKTKEAHAKNQANLMLYSDDE